MSRFTFLAVAAVMLGACATQPEVDNTVELDLGPVLGPGGCYYKEDLQRVVIPAEYRTINQVTMINQDPQWLPDPETGEFRWVELAPIEQKIPREILIKEEQVLYTKEGGEVVTNLCAEETPPMDAAAVN